MANLMQTKRETCNLYHHIALKTSCTFPAIIYAQNSMTELILEFRKIKILALTCICVRQ